MRTLVIALSLVLISILTATAAIAQHTTVYIVRHAEKNLNDPNTKDPALSTDGVQRSYDLEKLLAGEGIAAVFSTDYIRTRKTGEPLAKRIGKDITTYNPNQPAELVVKVMQEYQDKAVLIIGHSNTILQLVEAFGGKPTITEIRDNEYRNLFKLVLSDSGVSTKQMTFGR